MRPARSMPRGAPPGNFVPGLSPSGYLPRSSYVRAFALLAIIAILVALAVRA